MNKKNNDYYSYAIVIALILIVLDIVKFLAKQLSNTYLSVATTLTIIVGAVIVCWRFSKKNNGNVTFGNVFAYGFKTIMLVVVIYLVWFLLEAFIIFPNYKEVMLELQRQLTLKYVKVDEAVLDKQMKLNSDHFYLIHIGGLIFGTAILGAIGSLIGAAVAKKNPQAGNPFQQ